MARRQATRETLERRAPEVQPAEDELPPDIDPATGRPWDAVMDEPFDGDGELDAGFDDDDFDSNGDREGSQPTRTIAPRMRTFQARPGAAAADRAGDLAHKAADMFRTSETKESFRSSEFMVWGLASIAILIAAAFSDTFNAGRAWTLIAVVSAAYIVSRGISKAGMARGRDDRFR